MDWEGKVAAGGVICAATGTPLAPGSPCVSALAAVEAGRFERRDFSPDAWKAQDPERFLSWWRRIIPPPQAKAAKLDPAVLRQLYTDLRDREDPRQRALAYLCALALVRLKAFRLLRIERPGDGTSRMVVVERGSTNELTVLEPALSAADQQALLDDLMSVLSGT
ncbi:hypothetical protein LBMAG53_39270 [Planctomycetota bacterium]|nr:hypothetical protein LBMAG53_39270 [Planctomycetota bacterium]